MLQERETWEGRTTVLYWLQLCTRLSLSTLALAHYFHLWCALAPYVCSLVH